MRRIDTEGEKTSEPISVRPQHMASNSDGIPVLVGRAATGGRRVRYWVAPIAVGEDETTSSTLTAVEEDGARPPRALTCTVCAGALNDPVAGTCGHECCRSCAASTSTCKQCGKPFGRITEKRLIHWLSANRPTRCQAPGCKVSGSRAEVEAHEAECGLMQVSCPRYDLGCSSRFPRAEQQAHCAACPFVRCSSFIAATLGRLDALERDNRNLRTEVRTLTAAVRSHDLLWHSTMVCQDCGVHYFAGDDGSDDGRRDGPDERTTPCPDEWTTPCPDERSTPCLDERTTPAPISLPKTTTAVCGPSCARCAATPTVHIGGRAIDSKRLARKRPLEVVVPCPAKTDRQ